jgi:protocatechuate 3,4-dioxygenase beta subunit
MRSLRFLPAIILAVLLAAPPAVMAESPACRPTPEDALGPFYRPDAPFRSKVGEGYRLTGQVLSAADCRSLPRAAIEFWLIGPHGAYDDAHRATVFAGLGGWYRFESNFPAPYGSRPPHIHIRVTAPGHRELITQHYPEPRTKDGRFDLVLQPDNAPPAGRD